MSPRLSINRFAFSPPASNSASSAQRLTSLGLRPTSQLNEHALALPLTRPLLRGAASMAIAARGIHLCEAEHCSDPALIVTPQPIVTQPTGLVRALDNHPRRAILSDVVSNRMLQRECNVTPATRPRGRQPKRLRPLPNSQFLRRYDIEVVWLIIVAMTTRLIKRK